MPSNNFISPAGDKTRNEYLWNDDMTELVKVREIDIQKEINEAAKGCTINEQIARLMNGDQSVLRAGEPVYADVSEIPETTGEAMQQMENKVVAAYAQKVFKEKEKEKAQKEPTLDELKIKLEEANKKIADLEGAKK